MRNRSRRRRTIVYLAFMLFTLSLAVVSNRYTGLTQRVYSYTVEPMMSIYYVINTPVVWAKSLGQLVGAHLDTVNKNHALLHENHRMKAWQAEAVFLRFENETLKELLNMVSDHEVTPLTARVLTDSNTPYSRSILVSAGRQHGVEKGQAVLGADGIVGRVLYTGRKTSRVLLLSDPNARIPVKVLETGQMAILKGNNTRYPEVIFTEGDNPLSVGQHLVTSGAGGIFAPGLPVGMVHDIGRSVLVRPYNSLTNLDIVVIHLREVDGILDEAEPSETKPSEGS